MHSYGLRVASRHTPLEYLHRDGEKLALALYWSTFLVPVPEFVEL